jgi:hypothetical protein
MSRHTDINSPKTFDYNKFIKPNLSLKNIDTNQRYHDSN